MTKKVYHISGFDCPNCAAKAEAHLNKKENISYARLDFAGNRLYITYKDNAYTIDQLKEAIAEVEDDPLDIEESKGQIKQGQKIMTPKMWALIARIAYAVIITVVCLFFLVKPELNGLRFGLYCSAIVVIAYDIVWKVILHVKNRENILDHFLLITIATVGALVLGILSLINGDPEECIMKIGSVTIAHDEAMEAVMVSTLFQIGRIVELVATTKSKAAIMAAVELRVDKANLITENGIKVVNPEDLKVNDKIIVKVGELIPTDGEVIDGEASIDTSSLTGEFVPVIASKETKVYSGCLVKTGNITVKVNKEYKDSAVSKIIDLISQGGEKKSKADEFIAKFARFYTPIVVVIAILVFLIGALITKDWTTWVMKGLEILVIGCPCAIVISVPLAYFSGLGLASKNGIVIKGTNYLDELCNMGKLITDKTGTLTHGAFVIQVKKPNGVTEEELMDTIYAAESLSTHPIGKAICHGQNLKKVAAEQKDFLEVAGLGVETNYKGQHILAGSEKLMQKFNIEYTNVEEIGTAIHCAVDGKYYGYIVLSDQIKEDAQPMVNLLHSEKVEIILLTGDKEENTKDICNKLGIDRWQSQLLPEQKTTILVDEMETTKKAVAFIGDGINDAPSIIRSDIGIAMGGIGSDIAVENADIVIMNDDPAKVYDARKIAKMARATSIFNIVFALLLKVAVTLTAILINLPMWVAVLADTGLTVILVINSLLLLYRKVRRKRV